MIILQEWVQLATNHKIPGFFHHVINHELRGVLHLVLISGGVLVEEVEIVNYHSAW